MEQQTTLSLLRAIINDLYRLGVKPLTSSSLKELIRLLEHQIDGLIKLYDSTHELEELNQQLKTKMDEMKKDGWIIDWDKNVFLWGGRI